MGDDFNRAGDMEYVVIEGIKGVRIDPETGKPNPPEDERENFYLCSACGQAVDKRDLGQVFYHEDKGHRPMKQDS